MGPLAQIGLLIFGTLGSLYLTVILLRFLFQLVRADFYNPISQFIAKATNPVLIPLRRIIPGIYGIDLASLVLALLFHWAVMQLLAFIHPGGGLLNPGNAIVWSAIGILSLVLNIYFFGLIVMIIASWIAPMSHNPALMMIRQLVEPVMAPFRQLIPPMGGIDITPIFAFLAIQVCRVMVDYLARSVALPSAVVLGI